MVDSSEEGKLREGHSFCWFERELEETERPAKMSRTLLGGGIAGTPCKPASAQQGREIRFNSCKRTE